MTGLHKFRLKNFCFAFVTIAFCFAITWKSEARRTSVAEIYSTLTTDTIPATKKNGALIKMAPDTLPRIDSTLVTDSIATTKKVDTFSLKLSKDTLDAPVNYEAEDSAVLLVKEKKFLLYGNTKTTYKDVVLTAPRVVIDQETNIVTAYSSRDSMGTVITRAQFHQGAESFQSDTIEYNFKTQKGLTKNTYTKQDEFFIQAKLIKKINATTTFAKRVIMTTCDYDEPHFAFVSNKGKFINNKVAITGPVHPEFEGVPIPIYLPFGVFPLNPGRHSGLLPPQFTVNQQFGLGLEGFGYYHVLNQYFDVTLRGNIYSYGGWSANITPSYRKRYRYSGTFNLSIQHNKFNFKGDPDYNLVKTFNVSWTHSSSNRGTGANFSANVNAGSSKYNQYVTNNPYRNFQNQLSSSIAYSKTWVGKPYNLTLSANHNQNNSTRLINLILPDAGFTVSTIYPFQKKEPVGTPKWYEKIGVGYSGVARNQLSFYDTAHNTFKSLLDTLQWGAQHRFPISLQLPPLGNFIVSPSVSYEETWLTHRFSRRWNDGSKKVDTVINKKGFFTDRQLNFGLGFNTTIYGTYYFKHSKIKAIRHVIRPTFGFNYKPNLSSRNYDEIQIDSIGHRQALPQFEGNLFSGYSFGRYGGLSFGVDNNIEMKVRRKKDSVDKKIRLIDGFGFTSGYNFLQDSLKLQPFNLYLRSTLFEKLSITAQALLDPYQTDSFGRSVDRFVWQGNRFSVGRINSGSVSMSTQFQSKPKDPSKARNGAGNGLQNFREGVTDPSLLGDQQRLNDYINHNSAEFVDFNIPWSVNLSYSLYFSKRLKPDYSGYQTEVSSNISFNNSFSLTPKWIFSTNGFYDFNTNKLTQFTMSISRDMHCWQMSINVTPIGQYRYFNITLSPKSSILQNLKVNRTRYFYNY